MTDLPKHPVGVSLTPPFSDDGVALRKQDAPIPLADAQGDDVSAGPEVAVSTILIFAGIYVVALLALLLTKSPALT